MFGRRSNITEKSCFTINKHLCNRDRVEMFLKYLIRIYGCSITTYLCEELVFRFPFITDRELVFDPSA